MRRRLVLEQHIAVIVGFDGTELQVKYLCYLNRIAKSQSFKNNTYDPLLDDGFHLLMLDARATHYKDL